jgi:hypothetical protein
MKRLFACLLLILVVPIIAATIEPGTTRNLPFATTALAGHTLGGGFCQCGYPGCFCDPGEEIPPGIPEGEGVQPSEDAESAPTGSSGPDLSAAALFLGTALLILKRLL